MNRQEASLIERNRHFVLVLGKLECLKEKKVKTFFILIHDAWEKGAEVFNNATRIRTKE